MAEARFEVCEWAEEVACLLGDGSEIVPVARTREPQTCADHQADYNAEAAEKAWLEWKGAGEEAVREVEHLLGLEPRGKASGEGDP